MAFPPTWDEMERKDGRIRELEAGLHDVYVLLNEGDDLLLHRVCEAMETIDAVLEGVPAAAPEEMEVVRDLHHPDPFAHVPKPES